MIEAAGELTPLLADVALSNEAALTLAVTEEERQFLAGLVQWAASSTVDHAWYETASGELFVRYLPSGDHVSETWAYTLPPLTALDYLRASSKGTWLWDHVRVRGTQSEHRVPARQVS